MTTLERLKPILQKEFGYLFGIDDGVTLASFNADSLGLLELVLQIEDEFDVDLGEYESHISLNTTVRELADYIEKVSPRHVTQSENASEP